MNARLDSSRGHEAIDLKFVARHDCGPDPGVDCQVTITGSNWSSGGPSTISANLGKVHLSLIQLNALASAIESWVQLPLAHLAQKPFEYEVDLGFAPFESLLTRFRNRNDEVVEKGKPTITVRYSIGTFTGEAHFTTDPSGLERFAAGLRSGATKVGYTDA